MIPNPWDAGSARVLEALGFKALATTSSGFAFTLGRLDGTVTLDEIVQHVATLADVTDLPISVDLENGYGAEPESAALAVTRVAEAGAVGGSIEDYDPGGYLYELPHAVERVAAAVEAARRLDWPFTLTARAENHLRGIPTSTTRSRGCRPSRRPAPTFFTRRAWKRRAEIRALCDAVSKPVNVLARRGLTFATITEAGAQRISVGGSLTWTAVNALADAATEIRDHGDFWSLGDGSRLREWLAERPFPTSS